MQVMLSPEERAARQQKREQREAEMKLRNNRLGLNIFQGSWIMVFICLVVVNWQMGFSPGWRPDASQQPDAFLPTVATLALLASTWFARAGRQAVERDQQKTFLQQWLYAMGLGAVFFVIMLTQFFAIPQGTDGAQYGTMYRVMIGYHAIHAAVIGVMMVQVWRFGRAGRYGAANSWSVEATTKLWYFVTVAWILFYIVLYWIG